MTTKNTISSTESTTPRGRLASLDALRGLDMFFLVGIGGIFRALPELSDNQIFQFLADQCTHPKWHGFTLWDLIFPLFIFTVGVSISFSLAKRAERDGKALALCELRHARSVIQILTSRRREARLWRRRWLA